MDIADVRQAVFGRGNLRVTWADSNGAQRVDNLSPRAQENLLKALLSAPPATVDRLLAATNVQLYQNERGDTVLLAHLGPGIAVHIALPEPNPERLRVLLGEDPATWKGPTLQ